MTSHADLPRYTLSVVASFLDERDGTSFLLTTRSSAQWVLPLFRVPRRKSSKGIENGANSGFVARHRFAVLPVQDPRTLLDRSNTKRLRRRVSLLRRRSSLTTTSPSADHWLGLSPGPCAYERGRTTHDLARLEWNAAVRAHHSEGVGGGGADERKKRDGGNTPSSNDGARMTRWPAPLELRSWGATLRCRAPYRDDEERTLDDSRARGEDDSPLPPALLKSVPRGPPAATGLARRRCGVETLLASYPRSGNTLLRTLLERTTKIVTGSDTRPNRTLSLSLARDHDLVGEGLTGDGTVCSGNSDVHVVKTHWPERRGWAVYDARRVILLVRNPYDAIDSYWNLCLTNTHTRTVHESVYRRFWDKFEAMARHEIQVWLDFHYYWLDVCAKERVPLLVVRYEDLVSDTEEQMRRVLKFLINCGSGVGGGSCAGSHEENGLGSFWEWRIRHALGKTKMCDETKGASGTYPSVNGEITSGLGSYRPRSSGGGLSSIGKSIRKRRYSESMLAHMHDVAVSMELTRKSEEEGEGGGMWDSFSGGFDRADQGKRTTLLQKFGYDIHTQGFPTLSTEISKSYRSCLRVLNPEDIGGKVQLNKGPEIRSKDDPFGRAMTAWRRQQTDDDTDPFPTVPR